MKKLLTLISLSTILFYSCSKKDDADGIGSGEIAMDIKVSSPKFSDNVLSNKLASNYAYNPVEENVIDYNKDYILVSELSTVPPENYLPNSKVLAKQANTTPGTHDIDLGDAYKLLVFKSSTGELVLDLNLTSGATDNPKVLLGRNVKYTFIAYSLNKTDKNELDDMLYPKTGTKTLSNSYIQVVGNEDLLYYREELTTPIAATGFLNVVLKHKFNLLRTVVDVYYSGYPINNIAANMSTPKNTARINFSSSNQEIIRSSTASNVVNLSFDLDTAPLPQGVTRPAPVANSLATSNQFIYNTENGQSLLNITTLKIGDITNSGTIKPFRSVSLQSGTEYNLSVKMVPRDSLYIVSVDSSGVIRDHAVARINGQVWMRYNLGANVQDDGVYNASVTGAYDTPGSRIQGSFYQYGKKLPFLNGRWANTSNVSGYINTEDTYSHYGLPRASANVWNRGSEANPQKGTLDPCPAGFRLPTETEYKQLINSVYASSVQGYGGDFNNAMRLTSKRNKSVILTLPAQGYVGEGSYSDGYSSPYSISERGVSSYTKASTYINKGISSANPADYIILQYKLLQGLSNASIYTGPGGGKTSASTVGHAVRCIAEGNSSRILLNDRVITPSDGGNVSF